MLCFLLLGSFLGTKSQEHAGLWLDVPFVKQPETGCGAAAISMLLQYWKAHGASIDPQRFDAAVIQGKLYSQKARGIFASDMADYIRDSGFRVFPLKGEWKDLSEHLKLGRPLIVGLQPEHAKAPAHYVLIVGIDSQNTAVFLNDPARGKLIRVSRAEFESQWLPDQNWMLLAIPEKAS